jgi:hypothetical protein
VENGINSSESYIYSGHEVKSLVAMQSILYVGFGREPLMKMPNIKLFSEDSCM